MKKMFDISYLPIVFVREEWEWHSSIKIFPNGFFSSIVKLFNLKYMLCAAEEKMDQTSTYIYVLRMWSEHLLKQPTKN
jgi:hypothetical protein